MNQKKRVDKIVEITRAFIDEFGSLSQEQLNTKPSEGSWSIAEIIDHIITVNKSYPPKIKEIRENQQKLPFTGKIGFLRKLFGNLILKMSEPSRKKKVKTFDIWKPSHSNHGKEILEKFKTHQEELKELIVSSEELIDSGAVLSSPANKYIVYNLDTAFDIIITHEERHLNQAREAFEIISHS